MAITVLVLSSCVPAAYPERLRAAGAVIYVAAKAEVARRELTATTDHDRAVLADATALLDAYREWMAGRGGLTQEQAIEVLHTAADLLATLRK